MLFEVGIDCKFEAQDEPIHDKLIVEELWVYCWDIKEVGWAGVYGLELEGTRDASRV